MNLIPRPPIEDILYGSVSDSIEVLLTSLISENIRRSLKNLYSFLTHHLPMCTGDEEYDEEGIILN